MNLPYKVLFENPTNNDSLIVGYRSAEKAKDVVKQFNECVGGNIQATYLGVEKSSLQGAK